MAGTCFLPIAHTALRPHSYSTSQCSKPAMSSERLSFLCAVARNNYPTSELIAAAQERAALRAAESSREEPLFHDPYAACLAEEALIAANGDDVGCYELATSFIDDNLMEAVNKEDSLVRQVVLLTDGMDTRPFRLSWPLASTVFDVSPSATFKLAAQRLEAVGARIRRGSMFRHVSVILSEDGDWKDDSWERSLVRLGYQGTRPSVWAMQGLQSLSSEGLEVVLNCISSLAVKDSIVFGELPYSALGGVSQDNISAALSRVFGSIGFHVRLVLHKEISAGLSSQKRTLKVVNEQHDGRLVFVAKQLRLSDHQVDDMRRMIYDREEVDEDGFED